MIVVGRFLGFVRPLMPFISGASRMPLRRFLPYDVLAAGLWAITFCVLGFVFWRSIDQLTTYVSRGLFALGTLVALIAGIVALIHLRRSPEARAKVRDWIDERDDRPGWRILAKIAPARLAPAAQARRGGRRLHRALQPRPPDPRQPRPRADDAARDRARRRLRVLPARRRRAAAGRAADRPVGRGRRPAAAQRHAGRHRQGRDPHRLLAGHRDAGRGHGDLRRRAPAPDRGRLARRGLADRLRARAHHQGRLRPRPPAGRPGRHLQRGLSVGPLGVRHRPDRVRDGARPRRASAGRCGSPP